MTPTQRTHASGAAGHMSRRVAHGGLAGLAGGVIFGAMMAMMGMMPMIGALVGVESAAVGWIVHMVISLIFGVVFGVVLTVSGTVALLLAGAVYGVVLWVIGPLLIMPAMMGMPVMMVDAMAMQSLIGHIIFGLVAGVVLKLLRRQTSTLDVGDARPQHA